MNNGSTQHREHLIDAIIAQPRPTRYGLRRPPTRGGCGTAPARRRIEAIPDEDWRPIPYWIDGEADVAETTWTPFAADHDDAVPVRLIVRRVRPIPGSQLALFSEGVSVNDVKEATLTCPQGKLVGGGFNSDSTYVHAARSHPTSDTTWEVLMRNEGAFAGNFRVYVICLTVS
mgnify:CR=1 FL=1